MAPPIPPQDRDDSRNETEEERNDRVREELRARLPSMAGLSGRGELSVSQEDAREIQRRSEGETRLRNSERLIRARDAHRRFQHEHPPSHFNAEGVGGINQTLTESQDRLITASPRPDSPISAPRYRPVGQTENANELHVRHNQPATERTRWSDSTLESRLAPAGGQDISSLEALQPTQARSYMPTLRSQPEFYMTGVIAVDTTAGPLPDNAECTICLEPLSDDVVKFHACGHMFHTVCVQSWFDQSAPRTGVKRGTCPNCRHELYEPDPRFGRPHAQQTLLAEPARPHMPAPPRLTTGDVLQVVPPALPRAVETPPSDAPRVTGSSDTDARRAPFVHDMQERVRAHEQQEQQAANALAPAPDLDVVSVTRVPAVAPGSHLPGYGPHRIESSESSRGGTMERDRPLPQIHPNNSHPINAAINDTMADTRREILSQQQRAQEQQQQVFERSRASAAMTEALRQFAASGESEAGDGLANSAVSGEYPSVDNIQPRESRAALAARAIAERRPLTEVPGLNNGVAAIPPLSPQDAAQPFRIRELPGEGLDLATRTTDQLREEQVMLLYRLRAIQTQIGRNLEASGQPAMNAFERREQLREMARNNPHTAHLYGGPASGVQDNTTHRPPPIAIPVLADPSITDLRSSRELTDPRAIGTGNAIWSTQYVAPSRDTWGGLSPSMASNRSLGSPHGPYPSSPGIHRDVSRIHSPLFPLSPDSPRATTNSNMLHGRTLDDERFALPASITRSEAVPDQPPAYGSEQTSTLDHTQSVPFVGRASSTVIRFRQGDSLPLRHAPIEPLSRVRVARSATHRRARAAAASDRERPAPIVSQSDSPSEDGNSPDVPETLS